MNHSQYIELTSLLQGFTGNAGTLRLVFSKVEIPADPDTLEPGRPSTQRVASDQAKQHPGFPFRYRMLDNEETAVRDTLTLMDGTVDSWTASNQERADKGLGPTADERKLYSAMSDFMVATETPVDGARGLYIRLRHKVRAWMDQAVTWFPELYPPFVRELLAHPDYLKAVNDTHQITPPFTWNESLKELAEWLVDTDLLSRPKTTSIGRTSNNWMLVDRLFLVDGEPVTAKQLRNAIKH